MQRGVQQRRVQAETGGVAARGLRQRDLGEHLLAPPPGGAQTPEDRAVAEAGGGQPLVEVRHVHGGRAGRGPRAQLEGRARQAEPGASTPVACRVHGWSGVGVLPGGSKGSPRGGRPPRRPSTDELHLDAAALAGAPAAPPASAPPGPPQPTWSPARMASSTKAVPGSRTEPTTAWSASHGCDCTESRPVNR